MLTTGSIAELRAAVDDARRRGVSIGLVPTMGSLHEGHLSLVDEARRRIGFVVMSIFVNPLQFGPHEDYETYPRDRAGDSAKAQGRGVQLLFTPSVHTIYPRERTVEVTPLKLGEHWEGAARPGHFTGVLTVVAKLFNLVQPDVAVFGQKDMQQATLIRAMVEDLNFPVEVVIAPTVRESDGLAMSSRNAYLCPEDRVRATVLFRALSAMSAAFDAGLRDAAELLRVGCNMLHEEPEVRPEYLAVLDPHRLQPVETAKIGSVVAVAARIGRTRLIDNVILGVS